MRAFAWFMGMFLLGFAVIAVVTYPVWLLVHPYVDWPFHRIGGRLGQLVLLIALVVLARRLGVADKQSFGYGLPRRLFIREQLKALGLGVATMVPIIVIMALLGLRSWKNGVAPDAGFLAQIAVKGLLTGLVVALIEETFLRGAMFTAVARESGARVAIVLTSLLYAATHFFVSYKVPADQVTALSGLSLVTGTLDKFADPMAILDAFLCLFAVGVLLACVRAATGHIAACMGLHAGWVWVITFVRETSQPNDAHPLRFLLSQFDGLVGWLVLAWTVVIGLVLYRLYARRPPAVTLQRAG
ncbi:MAG: CPBP family intramembrane glutamic endopeptidase [Gammaproteobacteria bacterium]